MTERERLLRLRQLCLDDWPLILTHSCAELAFRLDHMVDVPTFQDEMRAQSTQLAVPVPGLPSITVPTGVADGLPVGVQLIAGRYREDLCREAAEAIEARSGMRTPINPR